MNHFRFTILLYGIVAFFAAAAIPKSALAWTWNYKGIAYNGPSLCVKGDAGIDHIRPGLFSGNLAYATTYAFGNACSTGLNLPNGWAASRLDVYKYAGSTWVVCRRTDWQYGGTSSGKWIGDIFTGPTGPSSLIDYGGSYSCGTGWYATMAYAYVWDGSQWRGGGVWSGAEWVQ
ncbi:MAG: hypothetical protein HRU78_02180 [Gammaproteobacteria bacterium]|nr:MAG: hypothetical protein HRU78_02180 [Gammaproteobacteria bacterium]